MTTSRLRISRASSDWWNAYVGIPFRWNGTDRAGVSCWGLVCLVQAEVFCRRLPRHDEFEAGLVSGAAGEAAGFLGLGREIALADVRPGDVLHMRGVHAGRVVPLHCGVVAVPGQVLHVEQGTGSHVRSYARDARFRNRILGAYRLG